MNWIEEPINEAEIDSFCVVRVCSSKKVCHTYLCVILLS
jgi:hypothetical protein